MWWLDRNFNNSFSRYYKSTIEQNENKLREPGSGTQWLLSMTFPCIKGWHSSPESPPAAGKLHMCKAVLQVALVSSTPFPLSFFVLLKFKRKIKSLRYISLKNWPADHVLVFLKGLWEYVFTWGSATRRNHIFPLSYIFLSDPDRNWRASGGNNRHLQRCFATFKAPPLPHIPAPGTEGDQGFKPSLYMVTCALHFINSDFQCCIIHIFFLHRKDERNHNTEVSFIVWQITRLKRRLQTWLNSTLSQLFNHPYQQVLLSLSHTCLWKIMWVAPKYLKTLLLGSHGIPCHGKTWHFYKILMADRRCSDRFLKCHSLH